MYTALLSETKTGHLKDVPKWFVICTFDILPSGGNVRGFRIFFLAQVE